MIDTGSRSRGSPPGAAEAGRPAYGHFVRGRAAEPTRLDPRPSGDRPLLAPLPKRRNDAPADRTHTGLAAGQRPGGEARQGELHA